MTRDELIAALKKATGPCALLDADIWREIGRPDMRTHHGRRCILCYTDSIDAAMTLVPEGKRWRVSSVPKHGYAGASVSNGSILATATQEWEGHHFIPAIALCIAALRARK